MAVQVWRLIVGVLGGHVHKLATAPGGRAAGPCASRETHAPRAIGRAFVSACPAVSCCGRLGRLSSSAVDDEIGRPAQGRPFFILCGPARAVARRASVSLLPPNSRSTPARVGFAEETSLLRPVAIGSFSTTRSDVGIRARAK
jgi:hypothetical protein